MQSTYLDLHPTAATTALLAQEQSQLDRILPNFFGYHLLLLSPYYYPHHVAKSVIMHRVWMHPEHDTHPSGSSSLQGEYDTLPFSNDAIDLVVCPHLLSHLLTPQAVLSEIYRVLRPEGALILTGLNPYSLWGLWKTIQSLSKVNVPPSYSIYEVEQWLLCAGFQMDRYQTTFFRPPLASAALLNKLAFLDRWGQRYLPSFGATYTIVAIKRELQWIPPVEWEGLPSPVWGRPCAAQQNNRGTST